jgi:ABC-type polysaccharide/polyol phosphate transport system ATPase subunit
MKASLSYASTQRGGPEIVLLDEVHEALDHHFRTAVDDDIAGVLAAGGIVVAAGHDHALLERLCTRALLLEAGRIVADGPFREVQELYLG